MSFAGGMRNLQREMENERPCERSYVLFFVFSLLLC